MAAAGRIVVALADSSDSGATGESHAAVASLVLEQIADTLGLARCGGRSTAAVADTNAGVDVRQIAARDGRDALDAGVDVLVTRDAAVLGYAASRGDLVSVPLAWDHTYLLLVSRRAPVAVTARPDTAGVALRAALASDAVAVESRPFTSARWWTSSAECDADTRRARGTDPSTGAAPAAARGSSTIIFARGDSVARALAARIAVLGSTGSRSLATVAPGLESAGTEMAAVGLAADQLASALANGTNAAYIVAVPSRTSPSCDDWRHLAELAPWLAVGDGDRALDAIPLIETRARAIIRRDALARIGAFRDSASLAQSLGRGP